MFICILLGDIGDDNGCGSLPDGHISHLADGGNPLTSFDKDLVFGS
jgi:hypothetical protein